MTVNLLRLSTNSDAVSDADVIAASLAEPERFALVFDRHAVAVHRYLSRRVGTAADDLLSETFLAAFRQRTTYQAVHADVRPWLFGIATNLVRRHARTEQRRYAALVRAGLDRNSVPDGEDDRVLDRVDATALRGSLAAGLAALTAGDRETLLLQAWGELTYPEIAAVLAIPIGTVRSRLNRARAQMRALLPPQVTDLLPTDPNGDPR